MLRILLILLLLLQPVAVWAKAAPLDRSKTRVAILPFDTPKNQPDMEQFGVGTMDSLITGLSNVPSFIMIDRGRIDRIIKEQAFAMTGLVDARTAVQTGKLLGAQVLVSGSIQSFNNQIRIVANFVDVQSGQIKASKQVTGADIFSLQDQLADQFIQHLRVAVTEEQQQRIEAVLKSTGNVSAYNYYQLGRKAYLQFTGAGYEEAIKWYNKALEQDQKYALAYVGLAEAYNFWGYLKQRRGELYQSEYQEAFSAANKAIRLNDKLAEAYRALGRAAGYLFRPGRLEAAQKAFSLKPNDAETAYELWFATKHADDPDNEYILKALQLNPDLAAARLDRGIALYDRKRYAEAITEFQKVLRILPQSDEAHSNLGNTFFALRRYAEAASEYKAAVQANPRDALSYGNLAIALFNLKRYDEALAAAQESVKLSGNSAVVFDTLGRILYAKQQYEPAVKAFKDALRINPNLAPAYDTMGDAMYALKWYGDAINAYRAAGSYNQPQKQLRRKLAHALFDDNRFEEAIPELQNALEEFPDEHELHYKLGTAYERLGKKEQAVQELEKYLKAVPGAANAADIQERLKRLKQ